MNAMKMYKNKTDLMQTFIGYNQGKMKQSNAHEWIADNNVGYNSNYKWVRSDRQIFDQISTITNTKYFQITYAQKNTLSKK